MCYAPQQQGGARGFANNTVMRYAYEHMNKPLTIGIVSTVLALVVIGEAFFLGTQYAAIDRKATSDDQNSQDQDAEDVWIKDDSVASTTPSPIKNPTPVPAVAFAEHSVGYIGCSMTMNAVEGYQSEGGTKLWNEIADFGGGSISVWAGLVQTAPAYWNGFEGILAKNPGTKAVWMELCTSVKKANGGTSDTYENALIMRQEILKRIPNAVIYVSAQPSYTGGHVCGIAGADGPSKMQEIADRLVAGRLAQKGPVLGPLSTAQIVDGCHANTSGKALMGQQMTAFFDR